MSAYPVSVVLVHVPDVPAVLIFAVPVPAVNIPDIPEGLKVPDICSDPVVSFPAVHVPAVSEGLAVLVPDVHAIMKFLLLQFSFLWFPQFLKFHVFNYFSFDSCSSGFCTSCQS